MNVRSVHFVGSYYRKKLSSYTNTLYAIALRNFVVPTRSVWLVILFRETGVVHRITYSFNYSFFYLFYLLNLFLI